VNRVRVRFGVRFSKLVPNLGILVRRNVRESDYEQFAAAIDGLRLLLTTFGWQDWAKAIVCEAEPEK